MHGKESVCSKSEGDNNPQIQAQTDRQVVGMKHDYKVYKGNHPDMPKDVMSMFDYGFLGVEWLKDMVNFCYFARDLVKIKNVKQELLLKASWYNKFLSL
ncbi:hypothetical protein BH23THE1_BH23THE1_12610 [soil metagenome]